MFKLLSYFTYAFHFILFTNLSKSVLVSTFPLRDNSSAEYWQEQTKKKQFKSVAFIYLFHVEAVSNHIQGHFEQGVDAGVSHVLLNLIPWPQNLCVHHFIILYYSDHAESHFQTFSDN